MVDPGWRHREFNSLLGALSKPDQRDVPLPYSVIANNVEFDVLAGDDSRGFARTRYGFGSTGVSTTVAHTALYDWISSLGHAAVYGSTANIVVNVIGGATSTLTLSNSATGMKFAKGGARLYAALFGSDGYGSIQGRVITKDSGGTYRLDTLFPPPITYTPSAPTEPGAGVVTAGAHRFGYIIEYRGGFFGRLQPDSGTGTPGVDDTFVPVSFTATGSKSLRWVLNTTWPTGAIRVHVAMAPVSNPNLFILVPGAKADVTGGALESHTINFDISDADLLATQGSGDVTENRLLYTQTTSNTGPFNPGCVFAYGDRMVYVTRINDSQGRAASAVFASERNKFQHITFTKHLIQAPNAQDVVTGFALNRELFLLAPNGTFATRDNGQHPVNWPSVREVNGQRGTEAVRGVAVNPDEGYAWVANRTGLYLFDGSNYHPDPITEGVEEWDTINWNRAQELQVVDDPDGRRVLVAAPIGATTGDLTVLCFYYGRGKESGRTDFSKWTTGTFKTGAIAVMVNDWASMPASTKKKVELCLISGEAANRKILRQKGADDTNPYRDYLTDSTDAGVQFQLRLAPFYDETISQIIRHEAMHLRAYGAGQLSLKAISLDDVRTYNLSTITLATSPGREYFRGIDKYEEGLMLDFSHSAKDDYVTLGGLRYYWQSGMSKR